LAADGNIEMLDLLGKTAARQGHALHDALVARARAPVFYTTFAVPDTIDGRFDLIALHGWLALSVLTAGGHDKAAQGLTDAIFIGFDEAMREQGSGDMGLGRKMKAFANAFYGRVSVYETAATPDDLAAALAKNLWRGAAPDGRAAVLAAYALAARESLKLSVPAALDFGPLPTI